jgi:hypothetical protein
MKDYINPILRVSTLLLIMAVALIQDRKINKMYEQNTLNVDSLQAELFILQTEVGKYEMALELYREKNPVGAEDFEKELNKETE